MPVSAKTGDPYRFVYAPSSTIFEYTQRYFHMERTQTYEVLRVAKALDRLPLCAAALDAGEISFSDVAEISKVATARSEKEWIDFARTHPFGDLRAEVKDADEKKRDRPDPDRSRSGGLPRRNVRIWFELAPEEHTRLEKALRKAAGELGAALGEKPVERKEALLYLAERLGAV